LSIVDTSSDNTITKITKLHRDLAPFSGLLKEVEPRHTNNKIIQVKGVTILTDKDLKKKSDDISNEIVSIFSEIQQMADSSKVRKWQGRDTKELQNNLHRPLIYRTESLFN
jgi:hypothetical protein